MNQSGKALKAATDYYHIETDRVLLIHDDLDLPLGRMKLVRNGGAGGHRGVLSVIEHLGSRAFHRLKIGIGRPRYRESIEDFVLNPFYSDEKSVVEKIIPLGVQACELFLSKGIDAAMGTINCQNLLNKEVKS
jgi:PTH1 family peptidyl-tRNA hydrolase